MIWFARWLLAKMAAWRSRREIRQTIKRLRALQRREGVHVLAVATAGKLCKVVVGATTVAEMGEWDYAPTMDLFDKTPFLATSKSHVVGLADGTGSFKGRLDLTDTLGQVALRNAMLAGTQVTLKLYVNAVNFITVPALIKGTPMKASVLGAVEATYDFQKDGDETFT